MRTRIRHNWFAVIAILLIVVVFFTKLIQRDSKTYLHSESAYLGKAIWEAPSLFIDRVTTGEERRMIIYGEDLIAHTAKYLGPRGIVAQQSNGMNCQNCHLDAGKRTWGNNFGAVYSTYPRYRERSGSIENIHKRVNDCFERSLNGQPLDTNSKEMKAIYAYIKWLGKEVPKGERPYGSALGKIEYLERAADPVKGKAVYITHCQSCHGVNGEGQFNPDSATYATPPLWGDQSYNDGAGLYRLSSFAFFVKNNMPFKLATPESPVLTNEEAWDVAAYVNSQPRPHKDQHTDWPDISKKPADFPIGPYADTFSQHQHKFGPFGPIETWKKMQQKQ